MKKIKIENLEDADKNSIFLKRRAYTLHLGNGNTVRFSDGTLAKAFQAEVNEELNFNLVRLNKMIIEVYTHYRRLWFYLNNGTTSDINERSIRGLFSDMDMDMDLMVTRSHYPNGHMFVFKYFRNCLDWLDEIVKMLQQAELNRNAYAEFRLLKAMLSEIDNIRLNISLIGYEKGTIHIQEGFPTLG